MTVKMARSIEATAKTIEDAINKAYELLGIDRDTAEAQVEVIDRPKSGFFGIGSVPAKVRITVEEPEPIPEPTLEPRVERTRPQPERRQSQPAQRQERPERQERRQPQRHQRTVAADEQQSAGAAVAVSAPSVPVAAAEPAAKAAAEPVSASGSAPETSAPRMPANPEQVTSIATAFLTGLLERMGAKATATMKFNDEGTLEIELVGEQLGMLIGRRGETLNAIQHITSYVVNKGRSERVRVTVDVENYRGKREESLQKLAHKTALKVVRYHRNISLEPMNAYERHVIHTALQDWRDVSTFSSGSEPRRCVVISYTPGNGGGAGEPRPQHKNGEQQGDGAPRAPRSGNRSGNRGGRRGGRRDSGNRDNRDKPQQEKPKSKPLEEQVWE